MQSLLNFTTLILIRDYFSPAMEQERDRFPLRVQKKGGYRKPVKKVGKKN